MAKPRLTNTDYCRAAEHLGCEVASIKAVAEQESLGAGFDNQDRPVILFERHIFHALTSGVYDKTHPGISNPVPGGYGASAAQYGRFSEAFALNPTVAMKSASWGKFQILGKNYDICGFTSVDAFVDAMKDSESKQLDAFCAFVLYNGLDIALTDHDWAGFAQGYNGKGFRKNAYDTKIAAGYARFSKEKIDCGQDSTATIQATAPTTADASATARTDTAPATETPPSIAPVQTADTIVNTGDIATPTPAPQDVTLAAPAGMGSVQSATKMTVLGFAVPTSVYTIFAAIKSAMDNGFVDAKDIGGAVMNFISQNTKYVFILIGGVITVIIVKKICRELIFLATVVSHMFPQLNNVTIVAPEIVPQSTKSWWRFW